MSRNGLSIEIVGARNKAGRFASLAHGELSRHLYEQSLALAREVETLYREMAPKSDGDGRAEPPRTGRFSTSIFAVPTPTGKGFSIAVTTSQPDLARYLDEGTGPHDIDAHGEYSLHSHTTDQFFGPHVKHPGSRKHVGWQERAAEAAEPLVRMQGNKIGRYVETRLRGRM